MNIHYILFSILWNIIVICINSRRSGKAEFEIVTIIQAETLLSDLMH